MSGYLGNMMVIPNYQLIQMTMWYLYINIIEKEMNGLLYRLQFHFFI